MKKLIVNADDFGFTRGVNAGIVRAFESGIVTSATIMANGDAFEDAVALARANPGLGVGCHLAAVGGRSVASPRELPSLVNREGLLPATLTQLMLKLVRGSVSADEIAREFRAQVRRVVDAGIAPTHLDTHKHSQIHPRVMEAAAQVASEFEIRCVRNPFERVFSLSRGDSHWRWTYLKQCILSAVTAPAALQFRELVRENQLKTPDKFFGVKMTGLLDSAAIRSIIETLGEGASELMCHPGINDIDLEGAPTRLKRQRELELEALCDPGLRLLAKERGIMLINYGEL